MHAVAQAREMQAHRFDGAIGVARADEFSDLPVCVDDAMHEGRQQGVFAVRVFRGYRRITTPLALAYQTRIMS